MMACDICCREPSRDVFDGITQDSVGGQRLVEHGSQRHGGAIHTAAMGERFFFKDGLKP